MQLLSPLTIVIRVVFWPLNTSQQRSMKKMQTLTPKLKELQSRYKSDPQLLQKKMMEFYKENSFNPFAGCFPLLLQLPIFILLYQALMSPQFNMVAGDSSFLFINRLDTTMKSYSERVENGKFGITERDSFSTDKIAKVYLQDGEVKEIKIDNPRKAVKIQGDIIPGEPVDLKIQIDSLKASFSTLEKLQSADISIINNSSRELETIKFDKQNGLLVAKVPTVKSETVYHYDVLFLVLLFGLTMFLSQKIMMGANKNAPMDSNQQAMQQSMSRIMPVAITATFVFIPIPAGVLLYLVASNVIQLAQTVIINKQLDVELNSTPKNISNKDVSGAKTVKAKKVDDK